MCDGILKTFQGIWTILPSFERLPAATGDLPQLHHDTGSLAFASNFPPSHFLTKSAPHQQDEEDRDYLMDEAGNIEPSQTANTARVGEGSVDPWGDSQDDLKYAAGLEDFEQSGGEIPDHLLRTCMLEFES